MAPLLVDSHCHLHMLQQENNNPDVYLRAARDQGVGHFLTVSVDLDSFPRLLALAEGHACISTSVGVHPCGPSLRMVSAEELAILADHPKVIAIGETGLDYLCTEETDRGWQHARFRTQIQAARLARKPLIIHTRGAAADTARILKEEGADAIGGIIHCFTENWTAAKAFMDLGFYISLSGILTFASAHGLRKVAKKLPQNRILIETDCPYLAPEPHRGEQNQPAYVVRLAEQLAALRCESLETVSAYTSGNFFRLFPLVALPDG